MGRVIHFKGKLASAKSYEGLEAVVLEFAEAHDLSVLFYGIHSLPASGSGSEAIHSNLLPGIFVQPGGFCGALVLEFDEDLCVQTSCNTALADSHVHILLMELLQKMKPLFSYLDIS